MGDIIKVAVLPIVDKKLFMCRKRELDYLVNLGGKLNPNESDEACAIRETEEEACCGVTDLAYYMTTRAPRQDEPGEIELRCYFGNLVGTPSINPNDKVYAHLWITRDWEGEGHTLPLSLSEVMPKLISDGYL
ncbi:NUDIX domain-containing protein [Candidatus Pacearchaeota archaeon]|nr:NUDIX domain-containing protein [Candidatus Pacearchaeota archaeon]